MSDVYDLVVIGSGFGSLFFVDGYVSKRPDHRVLVLERGEFHSHEWQVTHRRSSNVRPEETYRTEPTHKQWNFTIGQGGGTNCWYGQTPRFHPSDFKMHSRYGVAQDWPLSYDELDPFYARAEQRMSVAGDPAMAHILPRSTPFPLPAHHMTAVDKLMHAAQPQHHVPIATARASRALATRGQCCASARCSQCPANAKFTFENGFVDLRNRSNVTFQLGCEVTHLDCANNRVQGVVYRENGVERVVKGDLIVLGANAIHSPAILLRSGVNHPLTGVGIHEQLGFNVEALLDGVDNFDGGTITTALNYSLYDGDFRREYGGALIYFENRWPYGLRTEFGRWRQLAPLTIVVEDLPQNSNRVTLDPDGVARVSHARSSDYAQRGMQAAISKLEAVLAPLPVERLNVLAVRSTESHVQGSLRMGADPSTSVVDSKQLHHDVRNLVVVGSSVFPSGSCANPSLSVAALSLRSAELLA
jgi:choline dehydrogenase-like flavoprotein